MKRVSIGLGLALPVAVAALVFLLPQCSRVTPPSPDGAIKIGAVLPLTGDIASFGRAAKQGIDLALAEINQAGGINGRSLEVVYEDNRGQAADSVSAIQKLVSVNKVPVVMGAAASSNTLAICTIANRERVVLISPISSSKELAEKGGAYFFRVCPSDVVQAVMMAAWFDENAHKTAGIVFVNNSWGQGLKDEFVDSFTALGGRVVSVEACNEGDRDLRTQLSKLKAANPDALYAITYGREGGALLRQARELVLGFPVYGADVWGAPELLATAGAAATGVGIIVPTSFAGSDYDTFLMRFRDRYGDEPDTYASYAYDMMFIIALGLRSANSGDDLRNAIANTKYDGVTGKISFDEQGDVIGRGFERKILR